VCMVAVGEGLYYGQTLNILYYTFFCYLIIFIDLYDSRDTPVIATTTRDQNEQYEDAQECMRIMYYVNLRTICTYLVPISVGL